MLSLLLNTKVDGLHFPVRRLVHRNFSEGGSLGVGGYTLNKSTASRQIVENLRRDEYERLIRDWAC